MSWCLFFPPQHGSCATLVPSLWWFGHSLLLLLMHSATGCLFLFYDLLLCMSSTAHVSYFCLLYLHTVLSTCLSMDSIVLSKWRIGRMSQILPVRSDQLGDALYQSLVLDDLPSLSRAPEILWIVPCPPGTLSYTVLSHMVSFGRVLLCRDFEHAAPFHSPLRSFFFICYWWVQGVWIVIIIAKDTLDIQHLLFYLCHIT